MLSWGNVYEISFRQPEPPPAGTWASSNPPIFPIRVVGTDILNAIERYLKDTPVLSAPITKVELVIEGVYHGGIA